MTHAEFSGTDADRNRATVETLIERLRKAQQLKESLEAHFQTATPSTAANTDTRMIGATSAAQDASARGPALSGRPNLGSAPRSPPAPVNTSNPLAFVIFAAGVLALVFLIFSGLWTDQGPLRHNKITRPNISAPAIQSAPITQRQPSTTPDGASTKPAETAPAPTATFWQKADISKPCSEQADARRLGGKAREAFLAVCEKRGAKP